jgi:hypothetical protein
MTVTVKPVFTNHFHQTWPLVQDLFASALKFGGDEYTLDQIKALLAQGSWVLLVAVDEENKIHGAASVEFVNKPNDRVGLITAMAGKDIVNEDVFGQVCALLKANGATKVQCAARESAARLYKQVGLEERYTILEAKI